MKRIVAFLLCVLLVGSLMGEIGVVWAEENVVRITAYSVAASSSVPNVFHISLRMKWEGAKDALTKLDIVVADDGFRRVTGSDTYGYSISTEPLKISDSLLAKLNKNEEAPLDFHVIMMGSDNSLTLEFRHNGESNTGTIQVIKSIPDPPVIEPEPDPTPIDTTKYRPNLTVDTEAEMPLLDQETEELVIPIKNTAIYAANKITVAIEPADKSTPLFTANRITVSTTINTLSRDQVKDAKFDVQLAPGATTGIHQITVNYIFHNNHGDRFTDSETAFIRVENRNAAPRLAATSSHWLVPGQQSQVRFKITNSGATPARNVKVTLEGLDPSGVSVVNDIDVKYIDFIEGNGQAEVVYNLFPAPTLEGASTRLQMKIDYTDISGTTYSSTNALFLPLDGAVSAEEGVPRLIISKYSLSPQEIRAGNKFLLELDLQNTSRSKTITNLKVTIISEEGVFLPVDASNTLFIEAITPGEVVPATLSLSAKADAENKPYPLRITFEYEDNRGAAYNAQEMITIPVHQNSRLVVGEVMLYGEPMLYDMVPVNVEFYNLGKTTLYNLMVQAEGPFQLEGGRYFVGNFTPGASDSFNFAIIPNEPGELVGAVVFQFEDSIGTPLEVRREIKLNVMEPFFPEDPGFEEPMPVPTTNKWKYVGIGGAVLLVVVGGFFFWRRRRKQKKLELQRAEELTAAAQIVVPEIEYVGFDDEQPGPRNPKS